MHRVADQSLVRCQCPRPGGAAAGVRFALATPADDADVRRLLRENPMPGAISISLEREPDALAATAIEGDEHHTIVARDERTGRLIAMGSVSVRERYINGRPTRVGYLGQLRLDHRCRPRASVILGGYRFFRELHERLGVRLYLTSIAADNDTARRLLERSLPGMPTYRPLCDFVTLVFRRRRRPHEGNLIVRQGTPQLVPIICELLNESAARHQFAPTSSPSLLDSLRAHGLQPQHFRVMFEDDRALACAAVWDQRRTRQAVIRRYPPALRLARMPLNLLAPLTRLPSLPPLGKPIPLALVSHLATPSDRPELIEPLVRSLHGTAHTLGVDCIGVGLDARDPRLPILRRSFSGREYRTQHYAVHWQDGRAAAEAIDHDQLCHPEVALL